MYPPEKLTNVPENDAWKCLEDDPASFWGPVNFQGRTVKLQVGYVYIHHLVTKRLYLLLNCGTGRLANQWCRIFEKLKLDPKIAFDGEC